jgi:hypothetical protein
MGMLAPMLVDPVTHTDLLVASLRAGVLLTRHDLERVFLACVLQPRRIAAWEHILDTVQEERRVHYMNNVITVMRMCDHATRSRLSLPVELAEIVASFLGDHVSAVADRVRITAEDTVSNRGLYGVPLAPHASVPLSTYTLQALRMVLLDARDWNGDRRERLAQRWQVYRTLQTEQDITMLIRYKTTSTGADERANATRAKHDALYDMLYEDGSRDALSQWKKPAPRTYRELLEESPEKEEDEDVLMTDA